MVDPFEKLSIPQIQPQEELHREQQIPEQNPLLQAEGQMVLNGEIVLHENWAPVQDRLDQLAERMEEDENSMLQSLHLTNEELQLLRVRPIFTNRMANYHRQRNARKIEESKTKSGRKQAAVDQESDDYKGKAEVLAARARLMDPKDGCELVARDILSNEIVTYNNMPPREDVTGHDRRSNYKKFANVKPDNSRALKSAQKDVENLVNNLRRDLCLEVNASVPSELQVCVNAYYFTHIFGESAIKERVMARNEIKDKTSPEYRQRDQAVKQMSDFVLWQKANGSNYAITLTNDARNIRATELAIRQVKDESNASSTYHQMMIHLLEERLTPLQENYNSQIEKILTMQNMANTPKGSAFLTTQATLAQLQQEFMQEDATEATRLQIIGQAGDLFENFGYTP